MHLLLIDSPLHLWCLVRQRVLLLLVLAHTRKHTECMHLLFFDSPLHLWCLVRQRVLLLLVLALFLSIVLDLSLNKLSISGM
jgi:hypothetical protein